MKCKLNAQNWKARNVHGVRIGRSSLLSDTRVRIHIILNETMSVEPVYEPVRKSVREIPQAEAIHTTGEEENQRRIDHEKVPFSNRFIPDSSDGMWWGKSTTRRSANSTISSCGTLPSF